MEKYPARHPTIVLSVSGNGTAFRSPARAPRLSILMSQEGRESPRGRSRPWPPWWVQALIVAVLGPLIGVGAAMLMHALGY